MLNEKQHQSNTQHPNIKIKGSKGGLKSLAKLSHIITLVYRKKRKKGIKMAAAKIHKIYTVLFLLNNPCLPASKIYHSNITF